MMTSDQIEARVRYVSARLQKPLRLECRVTVVREADDTNTVWFERADVPTMAFPHEATS